MKQEGTTFASEMLQKQVFEGVAYQKQGEKYFDDGREIELLHFVYSHPNLERMRGNPAAVLDAIDEFGRTKKYLMNVGQYKAETVTKLIHEVKPRVMVELGGYVGYSAIAFGAALKASGGKKYYSLEYNPEFGAVIGSLTDLAGLGDIVQVEIGKSNDSLRRLHQQGVLQHIDLLFLDHLKPLYTPDLKLCEDIGIIGPGSVLAADNVVKPGNPPYLEYVRSTVEAKRSKIANGSSGDSFPLGNPNLIYESKFVEGWEPSGVPDAIEVTRCTGTTNRCSAGGL